MATAFAFFKLSAPSGFDHLRTVAWPAFKPLREQHPTSALSVGWLSDEGEFLHFLDGVARLRLAVESKRLPPRVVKEAVAERQKQVESTGRPLGKMELADLRREVELELLPRVFSQCAVTPVYLWPDGLFAVAASSQARIDKALATFLAAVGVECEVVRLKTAGVELKLAQLLSAPEGWLGESVTVARYARIAGAPLSKGTGQQAVACRGSDPTSEHVLQHVRSLGEVHALGFEFMVATQSNDESGDWTAFQCVINRDLHVRQIKWDRPQPDPPATPHLADIREACRVAAAVMPLLDSLQAAPHPAELAE